MTWGRIPATSLCWQLIRARLTAWWSRLNRFRISLPTAWLLLAANNLKDKVQTCQLALSDSTGQVRMFTPGSDATGVLQTALRGREIPDDEGISVEMTTLDDFVFNAGNPVPDLIKLDVEGAEAAVLAGATRVLSEVRPTILVEVHGTEPATAVWDLMHPLGYQCHLLTSAGEIEIPDRDRWLQNFAVSRWIIHHCVFSPRSAAVAAA